MTLYQTMLHNQKDRHRDYYTKEQLAQIFREFYQSAFKGLLEKPSATRISEKTPRNIFAAEHLLRLFPTAHYINLTRDGRDVVVSHLDVIDAVTRRRD